MAEDAFGLANRTARAEAWETRADPVLAFRTPELVQFRRLWHDLTSGNRLPSRGDLTARLMKPYLRNLSVMDIGQPGAKRFVHRFVGSEITRYMGDLTGVALDEFLPAHLLPRTTLFLDAIAAARRPVRVVTHFQLRQVDFLLAEIFGAPLATDGITPDKLITISYFFPAGFAELREDLARL